MGFDSSSGRNSIGLGTLCIVLSFAFYLGRGDDRTYEGLTIMTTVISVFF